MSRLVENAQLLARATRAAAVALGLELFAPGSPGAAVTTIKAPAGKSRVAANAALAVEDSDGGNNKSGQFLDFVDNRFLVARMRCCVCGHWPRGTARGRRVGYQARQPKRTIG